MNGLLLIDKPVGITSMDVIRRLRKKLNTRKLGHTGTLDPAATGLLPVTVGTCTKLAKFLELEPKIYSFEVVFGVLTETADDEGAVVGEGRSNVTAEEVEALLHEFTGTIEQRPPRYSAIRVDGKHAYELARAGVEFELPARTIHIQELELLTVEDGVAAMQVTCGTGTYVRSLAVDIAAKLGTVAHARKIRRLRVGAWTIADSIELEDATEADIMAPIDMMGQLPRVELSPEEVTAIQLGQAVPGALAEGFASLVHSGDLVAVAESKDGKLHPRRVLK